MKFTNLNKIVLTSTLLALGACGGSGDGGTNNDTASFTLNVTDAPIGDVQEVWVEFTGVTLKPAGGPEIVFSFDDEATEDIVETKSIDLASLTGMASANLIDNEEIPAGQYNQIRLHVNAELDGVMDSFVVVDGVVDGAVIVDGKQFELRVPSGSNSGLKLNTPFTVAAGSDGIEVGEESIYTIDFNLAKSVINPGGQVDPDKNPAYLLKPVLRLVQNIETGSISGTVQGDLVTEDCDGAVYAYVGGEADAVVIEDIGGSGDDPLTTTEISSEANLDGNFEYEFGYLSAGQYTLAFTCQANDETESEELDGTITFNDDDIAFSDPIFVTVEAGEEKVDQIFPASP